MRSGRATMRDRLVLDASGALAVLLGEPDGARVRSVIADAAGGQLLVVDLFWLELVNVLTRRHGWEAGAVVAAIRELDELGLETVAPDRPLLLAALDAAARHGISAYDAAHLALADAADADLLTLDVELARAAGDRSVLPPPHGVGEARVSYGSAAGSGPDWARHGRYLAELRRAAAS